MASQGPAAFLNQHQQQFHHQQLLLPHSYAAEGVERRGSTESAYYSIGSDRRASWQQQEGEPAWWLDSAATEAKQQYRSPGSVLCDDCETRRFQPVDKSPFHTRSHAEVVMEEFARFSGDRTAAAAAVAAAAAAAATSAADKDLPVLTRVPRPPPAASAAASQPAAAAAVTAGLHTTDPLPPLMEEIPEPPAGSGDQEDDASIGMVGRLNTISGDFRYKRQQRREAAAMASPEASIESLTPPLQQQQPRSSALAQPADSKRKFSLDARTMTTPSLGGRPAQLRLRPAVGLTAAASCGSRLFRLFHQETTPEQMASFNEQRRHSVKAPAPPDQNPSCLFRRFQSTDDDYFVALKVEDPKEEVFPKVQEREKLISVSNDGKTVVTELTSSASSESSEPPAGQTAAANAGDATDAAAAAAAAGESEIETALRLAKTSPFAYVPPKRLQPAPPGARLAERRPSASLPSAAAQQQIRRSSEPASSSSRMSGARLSIEDRSAGGSRVKQLMAKFSGGEA